MDAGAVAAALEEARSDVRQDFRHEDPADDVRGPAERVAVRLDLGLPRAAGKPESLRRSA